MASVFWRRSPERTITGSCRCAGTAPRFFSHLVGPVAVLEGLLRIRLSSERYLRPTSTPRASRKRSSLALSDRFDRALRHRGEGRAARAWVGREPEHLLPFPIRRWAPRPLDRRAGELREAPRGSERQRAVGAGHVLKQERSEAAHPVDFGQ